MFHSQRMLSISIISMSQNLVDLVDFVFHSQRRFEICMSQNVVELVDFVFHSQRRLKILSICISQKVVDLGDLGFSLIEA